MAELAPGVHRPRNVDWRRAAALLYGDWGTSKAYVIGLAFLTLGYSALPVIIAVSILSAIVAYNYVVVCRSFPDGGGVYSAARNQSRLLAVIGALFLVADFTVTAAMSGWAAMAYFGVSRAYVAPATVGVILVLGLINFFGPKHGGSMAVALAVPMVSVVIITIALSWPHLHTANLLAPHPGFKANWVAFVGVILALSGVEAIANLTGVMKLDPGSSMAHPKVSRTSAKAIGIVAIEVVLGTCLLGFAMLSVEPSMERELHARWEDMLRFLGEYYGTLTGSQLFGPGIGQAFGRVFGIVVGVVVGLLLLSAVNTAIAALIGLFFMMNRDGEMPPLFGKLNPFGVPWVPLMIATFLPIAVVASAQNLQSLAGLYAIGMVGAITVNLGSCSFNRALRLRPAERLIIGTTFLVMFAVEITIARTKPDALFFVLCVVGVGLGIRVFTLKRAGLRTVTISERLAAAVDPTAVVAFELAFKSGGAILVASRGVNPVLRFALSEAHLRKASLYVLYVKEVAVAFTATSPEGAEQPRWQDDPVAARIMVTMVEWGRQSDVQVVPLYAVSDNPASTILDLSATLGVDILVLGTPHRHALVSLLKGDVVNEVAQNLPESIQLLIYG